METTCKLCGRELTNKQDVVVVHQYPLISFDTARCHLLCFLIRMHQSGNLLAIEDANVSTNSSRSAVPLPKDVSCGYCKKSIHTDTEDHVIYQLCQHKHVHMRCASLVDFKRKRGCVLCYTREDERKCTVLWHNNTAQVAQNKETTRIIARKDAQSKSTSVHRSTAPINPAYIIPVIDGGYNAEYVKTTYSRNMAAMALPRFASPLRQYLFDKQKQAIVRPDGVQSFLLPLLYKYSFAELVTLGLTMKMLLADKEAVTYFVISMVGAPVCGMVDVSWDCSLVTMLLGGVNPQWLLRSLSTTDLAMIDFCMAGMLAGGVTASDIRKHVYGAATQGNTGQYSWFN